MSLHKLSAGDGYTYLTRQVAAVDATERGYTSLGAYYSAKGESPGVWAGRGLESLGVAGPVTERQMLNLFGMGIHPDADRITADLRAQGQGAPAAAAATRLGARFPVFQGTARWRSTLTDAYQAWNQARGRPTSEPVPEPVRERIRTDLATSMFREEYGRASADEAELSGFLARVSRPTSTAVAGFDLTFSPVKSVSAWWALAPLDVARVIEQAHHAAVKAAVGWLEKEAGYTRVGTRGPAQVQVRGLVTAQFTHRDSRAGDPDLHTHVAVSSKVQTLDGRWLALDARMLYRLNVAGSEYYNTALEAELHARLGARFADRAEPGTSKRPVREVVGVDPALIRRWSTRRQHITATRAQLADRFTARHGRVPTTVEMIALAQQANLATRQAKHAPRSLAEQRATWRAEALEVMHGQAGLASMLGDVDAGRPARPPAAAKSKKANAKARDGRKTAHHPAGFQLPDPKLTAQLAVSTVAVITGARAQWRHSNLAAEALRQVRAANIHPAHTITTAAAVTRAAEGLGVRVGDDPEAGVAAPVPAALRRSDGTSVYRMARGQLYTSREILAAEQRILAAAGRADARRLTAPDVELACLEWSAAHPGQVLNHAQHHLVQSVATSGRAVQLVLAPAGTGKTTAMGVLARAWTLSGGTVVGLAPQASAAQELAAAVPGIATDTVDKLVHDLTETPTRRWQTWMTRIGRNSLVIIDEAGLASTPKLDEAIEFVLGKGGRVLLVGDDRQRAAPGAGGVIKDIETLHGAVTLTEVLRFTHPVEAQVSLALRDGDPSVAGYYADHHRVHAATPDTAAQQVYTAWAADVAAGKESIMIAPTLAMVTELNALARADRLTRTGGPVGRELTLPNGDVISAGDLIITKRNNRELTLGDGGFVRNNDRWTVERIHPDGSITATEQRRHHTRTLPAEYLGEGNVRLGYAHTHASVQGMTVGSAHHHRAGTAHTVVTPGMTRNDLYPAATRAVDGTHLHVVVGGDGDPHDVVKPDAARPPTPVEILTQVITTDGAARSATTDTRDATDPTRRIGHAADAYTHAVTAGAETLIGPDRMAAITVLAEAAVPGVTTSPAWETLRGHLAVLAANGHDPITALAGAAAQRELDTANDLAAVLDYRLDPTGNHSQTEGPLPWLPAIPAVLADTTQWGPYLAARSALVADLADRIRAATTGWTPGDAPAWALPYLSDPNLAADLAVWRAAESVPDTDLRPAGQRPRRIAMAHRHTQLVQRAIAVDGDPADGADRWLSALTHHGVSAAIVEDDFWPVLAARLGLADTAALPVAALIKQAVEAGALPAENPAAALWWRLAPHLGPLAPGPGSHHLRPAWTDALTTVLGQQMAERIIADRLWPVIVAHLDTAARTGHQPQRLIADAAALLRAVRGTVKDHELAAILLCNLTTLIDPNPADPDDEPGHPDPTDADHEPEHEPAETVSTSRPAWAHLDVDDLPPEPPEDDDPPEPNIQEAEKVLDQQATDNAEPNQTIQRLHQAVAAGADFYRDSAADSWVPDYLAGRGLDPGPAGYAPAGWTTTIDHLRTLGFTDPELLAAGLASTSSRGTLIDHLRDRAVLPITTPDGRIAGFIGRKPPGDTNPGNPKYLNTPTTAVFDKSTLPYGLTPDAIARLRAGADLAIVEGPMDVAAVTAATSGRIVAVAPLGTALTSGHLQTLDRIAALGDRALLVAFDSDRAGQSAAVRAHHTLAAAGITHAETVTRLGGKDPAELLHEKGPAVLRAALTERRPLADLVVDDIVGRWPTADGTVESRVNALHEAAPAVAALSADQQARQAQRLSRALRIAIDNVWNAITDHHPEPSTTSEAKHPTFLDTELADRWRERRRAEREAAELFSLVLTVWDRPTTEAAKDNTGLTPSDLAGLAMQVHRLRDQGLDPQQLIAHLGLSASPAPGADPVGYVTSALRDAADDLELPPVHETIRNHMATVLTDAWTDQPGVAEQVTADLHFDRTVRALVAAEDDGIDLADLLRRVPAETVATCSDKATVLAHHIRTLDPESDPTPRPVEPSNWLRAGAEQIVQQAWAEHPEAADTVASGPAFDILADRMAIAQRAGYDATALLQNLAPETLTGPEVPSPSGMAAYAFDRELQAPQSLPYADRQFSDLTDEELTDRLAATQQHLGHLAVRRDLLLGEADQAQADAAAGNGPATQQARAELAAARAQLQRLDAYRHAEQQWQAAAERVRQVATAKALAEADRDSLGRISGTRRAELDARIRDLTVDQEAARTRGAAAVQRAQQITDVPADPAERDRLASTLAGTVQRSEMKLMDSQARDTRDAEQFPTRSDAIDRDINREQRILTELQAEARLRQQVPQAGRRNLADPQRHPYPQGAAASVATAEHTVSTATLDLPSRPPDPQIQPGI